MGHNKRLTAILSDQKALVAILVIGLVLSLSSGYFLTYNNIVNLFNFMSIEGPIVIGMAFLIILGELDLSVGSNMAFSCILAIEFQKYGVFAGILAGIAGGTLVGIVNGLLVTRLRITSLAVTLGMMVMISGIVFALTGSLTVKGTNENFTWLSSPIIWNISASIIIFLALVVGFQFLLKRTIFGRNVFAVGGNPFASKLSGIGVEQTRFACFSFTGSLAGLSGVLLAAKINVASGRFGDTTALMAITAVLLGGVNLSGGEGSVLKAFTGFVLIAVLNNAMVLLRLEPSLQDMIRGLILILILVVDAVNIERAKYA